MSVLGIETRWRKRSAPARPFVVVGPWRSESEVPGLVRSIVESLSLAPEVRVEWRSGSSERAAREADLTFGLVSGPSDTTQGAMLPTPDQLAGAAARRAAWTVLAQLRRTLRQQGRMRSA
ncbi:MAG: hypothetical protein RLZZ290_1701 [Pseudomonadota bacterium]|jgi:hypothetical protein